MGTLPPMYVCIFVNGITPHDMIIKTSIVTAHRFVERNFVDVNAVASHCAM